MSYIPKFNGVLSEEEAEQLNPLVLAFIGDSVETLYVRTKLVCTKTSKTNALHKLVANVINATTQSKTATHLIDYFTDKEYAIYKRARNSKVNTTAKNAKVTDYKKASGYEAVLGYLYLTAQSDRLEFLIKQGESNDN